MVCQHGFSCLVQRKKKKVKINVTFLKQSSKRIFIIVMELTRLYIVNSLKFIEPFLFSDWLGLRLVRILLLFYIAIIEITQEITRDIKWRRRRRFYKYL